MMSMRTSHLLGDFTLSTPVYGNKQTCSPVPREEMPEEPTPATLARRIVLDVRAM